jgi:hypothetical protein
MNRFKLTINNNVYYLKTIDQIVELTKIPYHKHMGILKYGRQINNKYNNIKIESLYNPTKKINSLSELVEHVEQYYK